MNCQFKDCKTPAEFEILHGPAQALVTCVCSRHMADEYVANIAKYSNCRYIRVGGDRTFKADPHVAQDVEMVQKAPIPEPPKEHSCGGCKGCH